MSIHGSLRFRKRTTSTSMKRTIKGLCICAVMTTALALQAADAGTTYLKLDAGLSIIDKLEPKDAGPDSEDVDMDPGVRLDVAGGYNFAKGFALELEAGLAYNEGKDVDLDFYQIPLIASVVYELPLQSKFKPYIGAGAGAVFSMVEADSDEVEVDDEDFTFAWQLMAGVNYAINDRTEIGIGYKFLANMEPEFEDAELDDVYTHAILAVIKFNF